MSDAEEKKAKAQSKAEAQKEYVENLTYDFECMDPSELRIVLEETERKRRKVRDDKAAYSKSCNDIIKDLVLRSDLILDVLHEQAVGEAREAVSAPPPAPPANSGPNR